MRLIFIQVVLAMLSAAWFLIVFEIKSHCLFYKVSFLPDYITIILFFDVMLVLLLAGLTYMATKLFTYLEIDTIKNCKECTLADNEFLPSYLGYFFIALSINDENVLAVFEIYVLLALGIFLSKSQYFNPLFLVMGYHFYYVVVEKNTKLFLIIKGDVIKDSSEIRFEHLRRINDTTFITKER